ncbi:MAG: CRISPR system precrRNA processing endoribonuclease RAMP protein Cas6 [Ktedonobacteraceae bacterium]
MVQVQEQENNGLVKAPDRLYALLIKLRPLAHGTLMPFSGELIHAAWLDWLRTAAPEIGALLHDGNRRRLFTCSNLQFPFLPAKIREAERGNIHLPLDPAKVYTIRLTLLLGELFPLFYSSLLHFSNKENGTQNQPFMRLGKQAFLLEEVVSSSEDASGWTGYTSFGTLVEKARALRLRVNETLELEFATLTTFHRGNASSPHGKYYALLPFPHYVFSWLAKRWQELAPPELAEIVQYERIERYIAEDGMIIEDHALHTHRVQFNRHPQRGFLGTCTYNLRGPDESDVPLGQLTIRQQIVLLSWLAFYTGVGYKTTMGMGQLRLR